MSLSPFQEPNRMNHSLTTTVRLSIFGLFALISLSAHCQDYYVKTETLQSPSGNEGKTYHYTKSITLRDGFVANGNNGSFTIKAIPVNPPPSLNQNFVRVEVPKVPVSSEKDLTLLSADDKSVSYAYSDGLGRTTMSSAAAAGPGYEDMVQYHHYDATTGRSDKSYLPYAKSYSNPGAFQSNAETQTTSFYGSPPIGRDADAKPFSYTEFDTRGRVSAVVSPGANWHKSGPASAKKTTYDYFVHDPTETNAAFDFPVAKWKISSGKPVTSENYGAKELSVTVVTDPQGRKMRTVKDMRGLSITSQVYDSSSQMWYGSYNVYDEFGRVRFVIPPVLCTSIGINTYIPDPTPTQINELIFQYEYDERGWIKQQKAPGAGWEYFVYDEWDRLVMTRHEGQQFDGGNSWTFYKYDAWNRQIMSGQIISTESRYTIQGKVDGYARFESKNTSSNEYTLTNSFPRLGIDYSNQNYELLTIKYYDNYDLPSEFNSAYLFRSYGGNEIPISDPLNLSTASQVRNLKNNSWLESIIYYDDDYRVLQTITENHVNGTDCITNEYDWEGKLLSSELEHSKLSTYLWVSKEYEYDHTGQLSKTWQTINGDWGSGDRVLVADYNYNVLGEMVEKNLHSLDGNSFLQSIDYKYGIHGGLKSINDPYNLDSENDLFGMDYHYEAADVSGLSTTNRFDGLMSAMTWNATNVTPFVDPLNGPKGQNKIGVAYNYNQKNQLVSTRYAEASGTSFNTKTGYFDMSAMYDDNGNIKELSRKSNNALIDDLTYTYANSNQSNKLTKVEDAGTEDGFSNFNRGTEIDYNGEYFYHPQTGNMTFDAHKEIELWYNHLQLVDRIQFKNGNPNFGGTVDITIEYAYDALGTLLSKEIMDGDNQTISKVDYVGAIEYLDGGLNQIFFDEGRVYVQNGEYHYEYFIKDHQGNNRVAFGDLPERNVYTATMESEAGSITANDRSDYEESYFTFPPNIRTITENHTPLGEESVALNGSLSGKEVGPAKVLTIYPGDRVEMEVRAKYNFSSWNNTSINDIVQIISSAFGGASTGTGAESASSSLSNSLNNAGTSGLFVNNTTNEPHAYLQYMFFDENYNFVSSGSGFTAVDSRSEGKFAKYGAQRYFNQKGYLFIYIANESSQNGEVFFDDFKITHSSSNSAFRVTQINDYYPFGLPTSNSWRAPGYIDPGLLYQSSYASYDSLTGYYDFLSRSYDPTIGRFFQVDPAGQFMSPYVGMGNMPHYVVDPDGEFVHILIGAAIGGVINLGIKAYQGKINSFGDGLKAFGIGALAGGVGAATGGAAFLAAGGAAGGVGGFAAGAIGGMVGSAFSLPVLSVGNHIGFGDPLMTGKEYLTGIALGGLIGGTVQGISAVSNGRNFWNGGLRGHGPTPVAAPLQGKGIEAPKPAEIPEPTLKRVNTNSNTQVARTPSTNDPLNANGLRIGGDGIDDGINLKPLVKANFRDNLKRVTGVNPASDMHAHHIIPNQFAKNPNLVNSGINVQSPSNGIWVPKGVHSTLHGAGYNSEWSAFLSVPRSASQIRQFSQYMLVKYGLH